MCVYVCVGVYVCVCECVSWVRVWLSSRVVMLLDEQLKGCEFKLHNSEEISCPSTPSHTSAPVLIETWNFLG